MDSEELRSQVSFVYNQPTSRTAMASALHEGLEEAGHECSEPADIGYAETFRCNFEGQNFSILVGLLSDDVREWLISTASRRWYWNRLWNTSDVENHRELARAVHRILKADSLITDLRWYTTEEWSDSRENDWKSQP